MACFLHTMVSISCLVMSVLYIAKKIVQGTPATAVKYMHRAVMKDFRLGPEFCLAEAAGFWSDQLKHACFG